MKDRLRRLLAWLFEPDFRDKFITASVLLFAVLSFINPASEGSFFLSDQLDQFLQFEEIVAGDMTALYGPVMSATTPPSYNFGPLGTVVMGFGPYFFDANPEQVNQYCIWLNALIWFVAIIITPFSFAPALVFVFAALFLQKGFWLLHSLLWVNAILVGLSLLIVALWFRVVEYRRWVDLLSLITAVLFAAHIHPSALPLLSLSIPGLLLVKNDRTIFSKKRLWLLPLGFAIIAAVGPYLVAELSTGGANTRSIIGNLVASKAHARPISGMSTVLAFGNAVVDGVKQLGITSVYVQALLLISSAFVAFLLKHKSDGKILWPLAGSSVVVAATAAFYILVKRPYHSEHYLTLGMPWLWLLAAGGIITLLRTWLSPRYALYVALLACCLSLVVVRAAIPLWQAHSDSTYRNIIAMLRESCAVAQQALHVKAGVDFRPYRRRSSNVASYLLRKEIPNCQLVDESNSKYWLFLGIRPERQQALIKPTGMMMIKQWPCDATLYQDSRR